MKNIIVILLSVNFLHLFAQTDSTSKESETDSTLVNSYAVDYQLEFPNINKVDYYFNKKKWKKLNRAIEKGDQVLELELLRNYVQHFGIQNFYKQTNLLWRLGQLEEKNGNVNEAKGIYRLVLHNNLNNVTKIRNYYDTLIDGDKTKYVSLEKYYNMVEARRNVDSLHPPRNVYTNMGKKINSKKSDYGPSINLETGELIYTSKRNIDQLGNVNEDIYHTIYSNGIWSEGEPIGLPINSGNNDGSPCLSKDGKFLYFARCNCLRCEGNCDIFVVERLSDNTWGKVKNLGVNINTEFWDSHPSLSPSGDTLYFSSNRPDGFGSADIWYSTKEGDGSWTVAKNMGPIINTKNAEVSPFFHPKYKVLYFSSNAEGRFHNFGGFDIYRSIYWYDKWREPRNVGPLVNGKGDEYYFTIDANSKKLYYSHSEEGDKDNLDLYAYPLPMGANPLANTKLEGKVVDVEENPFKGVMQIIDLDDGIEVAPINIRDDGSYEFSLIDNKNYLMVIHGEDFFRLEKQFHLNKDTKMDIEIPRVNVQKFVFENIDFETGSWEILDTMKTDLKKLLDFLVDNPFYLLRITGHTDSDGNEEDNKILSFNRANAIKEWLIENSYLQVGNDRIEAIGMGSSQPLVEKETSEEEKAMDRRVEFEILEEGAFDDGVDWGD